ncbi:hypothetical protein ACP70R_004875 [Stipagrostis hirtigluma subsp. patula]
MGVMGRRRTRDSEEDEIEDDEEYESDDAGMSGDEFDEFNDTQTDGAEEDDIDELDDEVLFSAIKKITCSTLKNILKEGGVRHGMKRKRDDGGNVSEVGGSQKVARSVTRSNVTYFSEIISQLDDRKRDLIERYGFGSLLQFDKCVVPLPFACWIAEHVDVRSSDIVVNNKSIPFSAESIHHVLGVPIGGKLIDRKQSSFAKSEFLKSTKLSTLPSFKHFGDELVSRRVSDEAVVRNFMLIALGTFLCPNSSTFPSGEYLLPLVNWKTAKGWDWSEFIHYWILKHVTKYQKRSISGKRSSTCLGGCLYFLCVYYLDFLVFDPRVIPQSLPRIGVWKQNMIKKFANLDRKNRKRHVYGSRPIKEIQSTCYWINGHGSTSHAAGVSAAPFFKKSVGAGSSIDVDHFKNRLSQTVNNIFDNQVLNEMSDIYVKHARGSSENIPGNVQNIIVDVVKYFYDISLENGAVNLDDNAHTAAAGNKSAENVHHQTDTADFEHSFHHADSGNKINDDVGYCDVGVPEVERNNIGGNSGVFVGTDGNLRNNVELGQQDGTSEGCGSDTLILSSNGDDYFEEEEIGSQCTEKVVDETIRSKNVADIIGSQQSSDSVAARTRSRRASLGQSPLCPLDNPEAIKRLNKRKKNGKSGGTVASPVTIDDDNVSVVNIPTDNVEKGASGFVVENKSMPAKSGVEDGTNEGEFLESGLNDYSDHDKSRRFHDDDAMKSVGHEQEAGNVVGSVCVGSPSFNHLLGSKKCDSESQQSSRGRDSAASLFHSVRKKTSSNDTSKSVHSVTKPVWKANMTFEETMSLWDDFGPSFRILEELDDCGNYIPDPKRRRPVGLPCDGKKIYSDGGFNAFNSTCESNVSKSCEVESENVQMTKDSGTEDVFQAVDIEEPVGVNSDEDCVILGGRTQKKCSTFVRPDCSNKFKAAENSISSNRTSSSTNDSIVEPLPLAIQYQTGEIVLVDSEPVTPKQAARTSSASMCAPGDLLYDEQKMKMRRVYDPNFELHSTSAGKHPRLKLRKRRIIKENSYYQNFQTNECKVMWPVSTEHHLQYETAVYYSEHRRYSKEIVIDYNCGVTVNFATFGKSLTRRNWVHPFVMNAFCFKMFHERPPKKSTEHFFFSTVGEYLLGKWDDEKDRLEKKEKVLYNLRRANSLSSLYQAANLYFPILHENHWSLFIVAVRDGYFCFLDPLYDEDDIYQKRLRQQLIPNFVKVWDEALEESYPFDEFVIHYPKIPKQNIQDRYYCGNDSGILVMKYVELWDPYVNMLTKFAANHVGNMRLLYVSEMVFNKFNLSELGKIMIRDHRRMVEEKEAMARSK